MSLKPTGSFASPEVVISDSIFYIHILSFVFAVRSAYF